jgi:hypothetical protein
MPAPKDRKRSGALRAVGDLLRAYVAKLLKQFRPPEQLMREVETRLTTDTPPSDDASTGANKAETKTRLPS